MRAERARIAARMLVDQLIDLVGIETVAELVLARRNT